MKPVLFMMKRGGLILVMMQMFFKLCQHAETIAEPAFAVLHFVKLMRLTVAAIPPFLLDIACNQIYLYTVIRL